MKENPKFESFIEGVRPERVEKEQELPRSLIDYLKRRSSVELCDAEGRVVGVETRVRKGNKEMRWILNPDGRLNNLLEIEYAGKRGEERERPVLIRYLDPQKKKPIREIKRELVFGEGEGDLPQLEEGFVVRELEPYDRAWQMCETTYDAKGNILKERKIAAETHFVEPKIHPPLPPFNECMSAGVTNDSRGTRVKINRGDEYVVYYSGNDVHSENITRYTIDPEGEKVRTGELRMRNYSFTWESFDPKSGRRIRDFSVEKRDDGSLKQSLSEFFYDKKGVLIKSVYKSRNPVKAQTWELNASLPKESLEVYEIYEQTKSGVTAQYFFSNGEPFSISFYREGERDPFAEVSLRKKELYEYSRSKDEYGKEKIEKTSVLDPMQVGNYLREAWDAKRTIETQLEVAK